MKIKMSKNSQGSIDGITVQLFNAGCEYEVSDGLAEVFISQRWADKVEEEQKSIKSAPMNKMEQVKNVKKGEK